MTIEVNLKAIWSFSRNIYLEINSYIGILKIGKNGAFIFHNILTNSYLKNKLNGHFLVASGY